MEVDTISEKVTSFLDEATKNLSPELLGWLKQQFDSGISNFLGGNLRKLKVGLVLDANIAIQAITYHAKGKKSILFHLEKNPIFPIYAPPEIEDEIIKYIENDAKTKKGYNKKKLEEGWNRLKKILTIKNVTNKKIRDMALKMMSEHDPLDAPFVSLYIDTGSVAILTEDHHYDELAIEKFNIEKLQDVVATFHRGVYSFFIFNDAIPLILKLMAELIAAIVKISFQFLMLVYNIGKGILTGAIDQIIDLFSRIPSSIQKGLGIALLIAGVFGAVLLIFNENLRKKFSTLIHSAWNKIKSFIEKILKWISGVVKTLVYYTKSTGPYAKISFVALADIYKNIMVISEEIKNLYAKSAYFA